MIRRQFVLTALFSVLVFIFITSANSASSKPLHRFQTGKEVRNLQYLLTGNPPSVYKIKAWRHPLNGVYDKRLSSAVRNMKFRLGYPSTSLNGNVAGQKFTGFLKGKRRPISFRITAGNRVVALQKQRYNLEHPPVNDKVATLVKDAQYLIGVSSKIGYTQSVLRMTIVRKHVHLPPLNQYLWEDCSSSVTGLYWLAGLPDPNGYTNPPYPGYGYTGTLASNGKVVWHLGQPLSLLRPGDLIFYGGGFPHHHVTMYLGNGRVFSHGTNSGPYNLPVLYRSDAVGAHRYVNVG